MSWLVVPKVYRRGYFSWEPVPRSVLPGVRVQDWTPFLQVLLYYLNTISMFVADNSLSLPGSG